jgi:ubiquinone/menaquinone biosynthesis C-methylase UbiE
MAWNNKTTTNESSSSSRITNNNNNDDATTTTTTTRSTIRPFEWLTSPESLGDLIEKHVPKNDNKSLSALHVGCGSSTVGEFLVEKLGFDRVVNIDRDDDVMRQMKSRWRNIAAANGEESTSSKNDNNNKEKTMEFVTIDFTKQNLPEQYDNMFDLIVDKSTLDCTLCSDTATASLLIEVYRTLKKNGGTYIVISFHEPGLLLPLLQDLPGARWTIEHTTMERQVERIAPAVANHTAANNNNNKIQQQEEPLPVHNQKPLNVLIARCCNVDDDPKDADKHIQLNFEDVCQHVHEVNDRWFQEQHPLLTEERFNDLRTAFGVQQQEQQEQQQSDNDDDNDVDEGISSNVLSLEEAFLVLFTPAEREHLTYEHFLEDWEAFIINDAATNSEIPTASITYQVAVRFLQQTQ